MSSNAEEVIINPDGSSTFETPINITVAPEDDTEPSFEEDATFEDAAAELVEKGTDPAIFLALCFILFVAIYFYFHKKGKKRQMEREAFFFDMDGDKFNIKLPAAVEEYYEVKEKCIQAGWEPGKPPTSAQEAANGPARILAQALLKRCIADIPLVTHIQKESAGMNKLYSQSMCSVKQWKTYQAAEAMVGAEVEEVRAEADEIEPGWSQAIWRQAMQYHNMIKSRNEIEAKAREAAAIKKAEEDAMEKLSPEELAKRKEAEAEKIAQELIKEEEQEKAKAKKNLKK